MLKFSFGNEKLNCLRKHLGLAPTEVSSFDLPAGFTCPMADICKTFANKETGKLVRVGEVKCYAAAVEGRYKNVRLAHWHNLDLISPIRTSVEVASLIEESLPKKAKIIRIHSSGDFFRPEYFSGWDIVAKNNPEVQFFGYTKVLDYVKYRKSDNFNLVYSYGSKDDYRWDATTPTCFIRVSDGQYPDVETICINKDNGYQDYQKILEGASFVINLH